MIRSPAVLAVMLVLLLAPSVEAQAVDWGLVDQAMGRPGAAQPDGLRRFSMPRTDLEVTVRDVTVAPALALGSWVAMKPRPDGTVLAMGDLVLTQDEVAPVMSRLQEGGVMQTALHNHLLFETPRVMFMHVHADGDGVRIARALRAALALTGTPAPGPSGAVAPEPGLDTAAVAEALGRRGQMAGGVYKVSVPRTEVIRVGGEEVPASMGLATAIGFQGTGRGRAAVTGDFVLAPSEVNPVIRALRDHGIAVTALHNHLLLDAPHLFFMHFWAVGDAVEVARGIRAALERMAVPAPAPDATDPAREAEVLGLVHAFHDRLAAGDSTAALALLDPDVLIYEGGRAETLTQYRQGHLSADMRFAAATDREITAEDVQVRGDVALYTADSHTTGRWRDRDIDSRGAETVVLVRRAGAWRIRHVHWSSR